MPLLYSVLYLALLGIVAHYVGEALPRRWLRYDRFPYRTCQWEREGKVYERLGVRQWKDRLPDMSRVMKDMIPKRVGIAPSAHDVWALVYETCRAEIVHAALCLLSPVLYLFWRNAIGVLLSLTAVFGNLPFIIIQRYNRPRLVSLARRLEAREEKKRNAYPDTVGEHGGRT